MPKIKPALVDFKEPAMSDSCSTALGDSNSGPATPIAIYFGSQSGTAEAFSGTIKRELEAEGISTVVLDLATFDPDRFASHKLVILVVATTGEGDAPDNAQMFNRFITAKARLPTTFSGLKYTVFGLGDLNYINFNQMGKRAELHMDRLGAVKIFPRGIGDASQDIEADLRRWIDGGLVEAIRESGIPTTPTPSPTSSGLPNLLTMNYVHPPFKFTKREGSCTLSKTFWTLDTAVVVSNKELRQQPESTSSTHEVVVKLPSPPEGESGYMICDSIEVLPKNDISLVLLYADFFNLSRHDLGRFIDFSPNEAAVPFPTPCTVQTALEQYMDLSTAPSRDFLEYLASLNRATPKLASALSKLASNALLMRELLHGSYMLGSLEVIRMFEFYFGEKIQISLNEFFQFGPKQKLRAYTGASATNPDREVRLVVSLTTNSCPSLEPLVWSLQAEGIFPTLPETTPFPARFINRPARIGTCSQFLNNSVVGQSLLVRVRESSLRLAPPEKPIESLVCIATGAGIAPFLAYMDFFEKSNSWPKHGVYLLFGCRSETGDFIYGDQLRRWETDGRIKAQFAFSRDSTLNRRVYVQSLLKADKQLHLLLEQVAAGEGHSQVVVCGSTAMGRSVCEVIAAQIGGQVKLENLQKRGILKVEYFG